MIEIEEIKFKCVPVHERYYSSDSSYGVFVFHTKDDIPEYDLVPPSPFQTDTEGLKMSMLVGNMQQLYIGSEYEVTATLDYNAKYKSYQYKPKIITSVTPKTEDQQKMFLTSIITDRQAETLLEKYPNIVEDIIKGTDNVDLKELKGIGEITYQSIKEKVLENYVISDILILLQPLGVKYSMIKKLLMGEPNPALLKEKLLDNPYIMLDLRGFGFKTVDSLALKLNPDIKVSAKRTYAFIKYHLKEIGNNQGHTWINIETLENAVRDNIPECMDVFERLIESEREKEIILHFDGDKVGLYNYYELERDVYSILKDIQSYPCLELNEEDINEGISQAEKEQGFELTDEQREVVKASLNDNVCIIAGKAGTGKSTISRALLNIYKHANYSISCCALSAKAAQRITEATGFPASTIHRLLGVNPQKGFEHDHENPLTSDVILIDECSMINSYVYHAIVSAIKEGAKLIMCGDNRQLPPIGYGNIFGDLLLKTDSLHISHLTKVLRQAEKSGILSDANKIREGIMPIEQPELRIVNGELQDMTYMFRDTRESLKNIAIKSYLKAIEQDGMDEVAIITPRKENCDNSTLEINNKVADIVIEDKSKYMKLGDKKYYIGSKVMQIENNYEKNVFNGEVGYITSIKDVIIGKEKTVEFTVEFKMNEQIKTVAYTRNELGQLDLAYCMTVHKCITEDTWLFTSDGLKQLKDFNNGALELNNKPLNTKIKVFNGDYLEKPCNFYNAGVSECKKITTKRGYSLTATQDHKLDVLYPDGIIRPKHVRDITESDYVVIQRGSNIYGNNIELPQSLYVDDKDLDVRTIKLKSPKYLTNEFARFLGYMVADGVICKAGLKYGKNHENVVVDFENIVYQIFGYVTPHKPKNVLPNGEKGGMYLSEINSRFIRDYCKKIDGIQPNNKYVPQIILSAPRQYQVEFLRSVFEDGSVCVKNNKFDHISFTAKEELLINQIQMMLLNMGIITTKFYRENNDGYKSFTLFIYGKNCDRFIKQIGFISNEKMEKSFKYYEKEKKQCDAYSIPYITKIILNVINKYNLKVSHIDHKLSSACKNEKITYTLLEKFLRYCNEHNIDNDSVSYLSDIFNNTDIEQVRTIENTIQQTYCIEMPLTHKFVQNGIRGWNCQGSGYKTVIIIIDMTHYTLLDTCLLYTAITRAKKRCLLLAEPQAFKMCMDNNKSKSRQTWLKEM